MKKKSVDGVQKPKKSKEYLLDHNHGFYVEDYFHEILSLERKRTERSKKPFLLVLIDLHKLLGMLGELGQKEAMEKIKTVLSSSPRETDITGWYKYNYAIGIIFMDVSVDGKKVIKEKIYKKLNVVFDLEEIKKIEISFHRFPEQSSNQSGEGEEAGFDLNLYSDLVRGDHKKYASIFKRMADIVGSVIGIIIFVPFFLIIPILIKLSSKGPVFFTQERVGKHGVKFPFIKFRTMYVNNDDSVHRNYIKELIREQKSTGSINGNEDEKVYKLQNDTRVTSLGKFLRKTSLDELPQFFNVLKGDMSLVGPRPPIPYELENYDTWHKRRVIEIKPGITCIWQVHGRSITTFDEMVRMDIQYIKKNSLAMDIKLLLSTPKAMASGKGGH